MCVTWPWDSCASYPAKLRERHRDGLIYVPNGRSWDRSDDCSSDGATIRQPSDPGDFNQLGTLLRESCCSWRRNLRRGRRSLPASSRSKASSPWGAGSCKWCHIQQLSTTQGRECLLETRPCQLIIPLAARARCSSAGDDIKWDGCEDCKDLQPWPQASPLGQVNRVTLAKIPRAVGSVRIQCMRRRWWVWKCCPWLPIVQEKDNLYKRRVKATERRWLSACLHAAVQGTSSWGQIIGRFIKTCSDSSRAQGCCVLSFRRSQARRVWLCSERVKSHLCFRCLDCSGWTERRIRCSIIHWHRLF